MAKSSLSLSGTWTGVYDYDDPTQDPVSFNADLMDIAGVLWGETSEPNTFSPIAAKHLIASVSGVRSGRRVTLTKEYQASVQGGEELVFYVGQVTQDGQRIKGVWHIRFPYEISGPFVMTRADGAVEARKQLRAATVDM